MAEKSVLITGGCGGMGRAVALCLQRKGYRVIVLDRRIQPMEGILTVEADVTSEESILRALAAVREHTSSLYAILHFAGIYMLDSLVEMSSEELRRIFDVNFYGAFLVNKTFLPLLSAGSRILITTSELAPLDPLPFTGVYAVSKAALDKYAYALGMELGLLGIRVSVLRAGAVATDMLGVSTDALERFCEKTELYTCNAARFRRIVSRVEARCISPEGLAARVSRILNKRAPRFAYTVNANPLLRLLGALPKRLQMYVIRRILR